MGEIVQNSHALLFRDVDVAKVKDAGHDCQNLALFSGRKAEYCHRIADLLQMAGIVQTVSTDLGVLALLAEK